MTWRVGTLRRGIRVVDDDGGILEPANRQALHRSFLVLHVHATDAI